MANIFGPGVAKSAVVSITVAPSGLALGMVVSIGTSPTTKVATSATVNFTSTGAAQNVTVPITMPATAGAYNVYIDILSGTDVIPPGFVAATGVTILTATIGSITWS